MAKDNTQLSTGDLDSLLSGISESPEADPLGAASEQESSDIPGDLSETHADQSGMGLDQASLDALVDSLDTETKEQSGGGATEASIADLSALSSSPASSSAKTDNMELLRDVRLRFTVELGRSKMLIKDVLKLGEGSVVGLDRDEGEDVDILVNDRVFGHGKLKLVDEYFGIQITKIEDKMGKYREISA